MRYWYTTVALCAVLVTGCVDDPNAAMVEPSAADIVKGKVDDAKIASLLRVAAASEASGDYANAAALYRSAYRLTANHKPANPAPLIGLGRTLAIMGAHDEAVEALRSALGIHPDDPETRRLLGNSLVNLGLPEAAKTQYALANEAGEDARTYNGLGVANDMSGDHLAAQAHYRAGLELAPGSLSLRNNLGLSLAIVGKFDEAIEILRRAAADPRAGARQRNNLALAYGLAGRTEAAARINRIYQDQQATNVNIAYYRTLRALRDTRETVNAIGVHIQGAVSALDGRMPLDSADREVPESRLDRDGAATPPAPAAPSEASERRSAPMPATADDTRRREPAPVATARPVPLVTANASRAETEEDEDALGYDLPLIDDRLALDGAPPRSSGPPDPVDIGSDGTSIVTTLSEAPTVTDGKPGQYVVQFASYLSRERAEAGWKQISRAAAKLLDGVRPDVQSVRLETSSAMRYRLRSQPLRGRREAEALCLSLQSRRIDCLVMKQLVAAPRPAARNGENGSPRPDAHHMVLHPAATAPDDLFSP